MIAVGVLVSLYAGYDGWKFYRKRKYLAVAGVVLLIMAAIGVPLALALFAT